MLGHEILIYSTIPNVIGRTDQVECQETNKNKRKKSKKEVWAHGRDSLEGGIDEKDSMSPSYFIHVTVHHNSCSNYPH